MTIVPIAFASLLGRPVREILDRRGIHYKAVEKGEVTWYNFRTCPCCGHGEYECGVSECQVSGRLVHAVKCFHVASNPWSTQNPTYADFLLHIGEVLPPRPTRRAAHSTLERRARRLRTTPAAMAYLTERNLRAETIHRFRLGLSEPYTDKDGIVRQDALTAPVLRSDGSFDFRTAYYRIPGLTKPDGKAKGWMAKEAAAYFSDALAAQPTLIVVEGMKDLWRLWQQLEEWGVRQQHLLVTSTHGVVIPRSWQGQEFWRQWETVYLSQDMDGAGDKMALDIARHAQRECRRIQLPACGRRGYDWTDWLNEAGRTLNDFRALLDASQAVRLPPVQATTANAGAERWDGDYQVERINPHGAFIARREGGQIKHYLYYATEIESRRTVIEDGVPIHTAQYRYIVVRSDRTRHDIRLVPAPKGGRGRAVLELYPDGARLDREPTPMRASWRWASIQAFLSGDAKARPLAKLLADLEGHLKARVWLPNAAHYAMLAAGLAVSYCQSVFQAVPLFMVVGPPGTGKTALARIASQLGANGYLIGQASAATAARVIDQTRGFVAFDDLEQIATRSRDDASFSDLVQSLKLSYNKDTAIKDWTDMGKHGAQTRTLNYFGIKLINNTRGTDDILGSRMLKIYTQLLSPARKQALGGLPPAPDIDIDDLRQELHIWAFQSVERIATMYADLYRGPSTRAEEIAAPLKVIAALADDEAFRMRLEQALCDQGRAGGGIEDPQAVLLEILRHLVQEGYRTAAPTHLRMELLLRMDPNTGKEREGDIPQWKSPTWLGLKLREVGAIEPTIEGDRPRAPQTRYQVRVYPLREAFIREVLDGKDAPSAVAPLSFCGEADNACQICVFQAAECPIMKHRADRLRGR